MKADFPGRLDTILKSFIPSLCSLPPHSLSFSLTLSTNWASHQAFAPMMNSTPAFWESLLQLLRTSLGRNCHRFSTHIFLICPNSLISGCLIPLNFPSVTQKTPFLSLEIKSFPVTILPHQKWPLAHDNPHFWPGRQSFTQQPPLSPHACFTFNGFSSSCSSPPRKCPSCFKNLP